MLWCYLFRLNGGWRVTRLIDIERLINVFFLMSYAWRMDAINPAVQHTWRIIPFNNKWLIVMFSKSPNWGNSPSKRPKWLINGGY